MVQNRSSFIKDYFKNWDASAFVLWYFLLGALSFNSLTAGRPLMTGLIAFTLAYATVRAVFSVIRFRAARPIPMLACFIAFFVSYGISTFVNRSYGITENLQALVWLFLCLFLVYPAAFYKKTSGAFRSRPLSRIFTDAVLGYTGLQAVISFALLIADYNWFRPTNIYLGFWYGRLWGTYTDPNYGAILSAASIIIALMYVMRRLTGPRGRILLALHILIQYLYIVFSYSRGCFIIMAVSLLLFYLYWSFAHRHTLKKRLVMGVLLLALALSAYPVRMGYNKIVDSLNASGSEFEHLSREEASLELELTAGRVAIWKNGFDLMKREPLFGVSFRNMLPYMQDQMPDCYMATHDEPLAACHNMVVDIAASQGITGLIILTFAVVLIASRSLRGWKSLTRERRDLAMTYGLPAVTILGGAMFLSDVFYINSPTTVTFWFCLGKWMAEITDQKASS
ncbi:MAG: O-antigen ligase family protein [Lachnospiraceae bacterium]|nr:O-antigen ligase family protein [Lachnospiraceae bacterium]